MRNDMKRVCIVALGAILGSGIGAYAQETPGGVTAGEVEAESKAQVTEQLRQRGLIEG